MKALLLIVMLSSQVVLTLLLGQVDIVMMELYLLIRRGVAGGGIALAFLGITPQLVLWLAPFLIWHWWNNRRRELV